MDKYSPPFPKHLISDYEDAVKRVIEMDEIDGSDVTRLSPDEALRTVMTALQAGLNGQRFDCIFDAYVMLQQMELHLRRVSSAENN